MMKRGTLSISIEDMADIASFIRDARLEERGRMEAKKESNRIRILLGLSGSVDIQKVAYRLGLFVEERSFIGEKVQEITRNTKIAIRQGLSYRERRWAMAHGIGHVILHGGYGNQVWLLINDQPMDRPEQGAETFAYHLSY